MNHGSPFNIESGITTQPAAHNITGSGYAVPVATPHQSGIEQGEFPSDSLSFTRPTNTSSEDERGGATKTEMVSIIIQILQGNPDVTGTESQKEVTFNSYLAEILSIQTPLDPLTRSNEQTRPPSDR
ncbi:hypothetical protein BYT27DRAFT_7254950 [Phlegmacium glaucopus]|nr:hypothetical protein BYT27DRAFT_7254950 [Phlegmacium glaucopus]